MGRQKRNKSIRTGWTTRLREKESKYAAQGYRFEVRLFHHSVWFSDGIIARKRYDDLVSSLKSATGRVHVAGLFRRSHGLLGRARINQINARIYLTDENDLFLLRLLTKEDHVFRVYRIVEPRSDDQPSRLPSGDGLGDGALVQ